MKVKNLEGRLDALERELVQARAKWFDLGTWKAEQAEGVPLDERERRRLAEYPEHAEEIRRYCALWRERLAAVTEILDPNHGEPAPAP